MKIASSSLQRPLILSNNNNNNSPKLYAYYSVHWEQNDNNMRFEINSCLYFQNNDESDEKIREDGCGYVITYPTSYIRNLLLTSNDIYLNSKNYYFFDLLIK